MPDQAHRDLDRLVALLAGLGSGADEAIGLLPVAQPGPSGYEQTPRGALTFAWTGGDGVHFSFLPAAGTEPGQWPVVMTVPMEFDRPNLIVGSNLREFLALGLRHGFLNLDYLVYDPGPAAAELQAAAEPDPGAALKIRTLDAITREFAIEPWDDIAGHLARLQDSLPLP